MNKYLWENYLQNFRSMVLIMRERENYFQNKMDIDPFYLDYTENPLSVLETCFSRVLARTETVKIERYI